AVDAIPPIVYAANDQRPRGAREEDLCERASTTDWLYMGVSAAAFVGSMYVDTAYFKFREQPGVRTIGPGLVGLTWGFTLGGGYLGALLPYLLPPKTWRNAKELERLRVEAGKTATLVTYTVRF